MCAEAPCQTRTDDAMLNHHTSFLVVPVAPTVAPDPVNAPAVVLDSVSALAAVADVAGFEIACQVSTDRKADGKSE